MKAQISAFKSFVLSRYFRLSIALAAPHNFLYVMPSLSIALIFITIKVFPNFPYDFFFGLFVI